MNKLKKKMRPATAVTISELSKFNYLNNNLETMHVANPFDVP